MARFLPAVLLSAVLPQLAAAAPTPAETLRAATDVLDEFAADPARTIPPAVLARARGVVVLPRVVKAGLVVGGRAGHGVLLTRRPDGGWGGPIFVGLGGASVGLQAGVEAADVVLVFPSRRSLDRLVAGRGKVTLGADAGAAAGPVGRHAGAATDGRMEAEILTYARGRGLFAGVSLDGAVLRPDAEANAAFARDNRPAARGLVTDLTGRLAAMGATPAAELPAAPAAPPVAPHPQGPSARPTGGAVFPLPPIGGVEADKLEVALSGLVAAAVGVGLRALRRRVAEGRVGHARAA